MFFSLNFCSFITQTHIYCKKKKRKPLTFSLIQYGRVHIGWQSEKTVPFNTLEMK